VSWCIPILCTDEKDLVFLEIIDNNECIRILYWISQVVYRFHYNAVKDQWIKDTCEWILKHNRYREWQDYSLSIILWLYRTCKLFLIVYIWVTRY
jgi:hypothetical protein